MVRPTGLRGRGRVFFQWFAQRAWRGFVFQWFAQRAWRGFVFQWSAQQVCGVGVGFFFQWFAQRAWRGFVFQWSAQQVCGVGVGFFFQWSAQHAWKGFRFSMVCPTGLEKVSFFSSSPNVSDFDMWRHANPLNSHTARAPCYMCTKYALYSTYSTF